MELCTLVIMTIVDLSYFDLVTKVLSYFDFSMYVLKATKKFLFALKVLFSESSRSLTDTQVCVR